jgi:carbamoyltransferase
VCVLEDAPKYFDGVCFEKMDAMQLAPKVKPEWREELSAVTHVDSTARLQTVTETDNSNFYSLLKKFDGVLLNTSFNIQRRPILNTLVDALWMLDKTGLDHVVFVQDDGTHWLF